MMWDQVMERIVTELRANAALMAIFTNGIRVAGSSDQLVPILEWTLIGDTENELWAPMIVQFDLWTRTAESGREAERRLRALYHRDAPRVLSDVRLWVQYDDGSILAMPDRAQFFGRAIRFRLTPLRRQYASV